MGFSRSSFCLNRSRARRRGRPAQHLAAICRPYAGVGPTHQVINAIMDATTHRTHPTLVRSLPPSLARDSDGGNAIAIVAESSASFARARLRVSPHLRASPSPPRAPPSSPPLRWTRSPRGELHFVSCRRRVHGRRDPESGEPRAAPSLPSFFLLSRVRVCLVLGCGPCHAIPASVPPSCGNTAAAPPR